MSLKPKVVEFGVEWPKIKRVLDKVLCGQKVENSAWMDRFLDVYNLTIAKPTNLGEQLYLHVTQYFKDHVVAAKDKVDSASPEALVETYHSCWMLYKNGVQTLNQLFSYLNTHFVKNSHIQDVSYNDFAVDDFMQVEELGLHTWKAHMLQTHKDLLTELIVQQIDLDRKGEGGLKAGMVREVVMSYVDVQKYADHSLEYYTEWLESVVLRKTEEYYSQQAQRLIIDSSPFEYVKKTLLLLDKESLRCHKYLDCSSGEKVIQVLRQVMVSRHLDYINRDIKKTIKDKDVENLSTLYQILQPIKSGLKPLIQELEDHYYNLSRHIIDNLNNNPANPPQEFITGLLKTHSSGCKLISQVFRNDQNFKSALDKALNQSINDKVEKRKNQLKPAEMLVRYCDGLLKRPQRDDGETEDRLVECITIFKYLDDKDFFNKYYSSLMAKRFICSTISSMEAEEFMINKLKEICGYEYTTKLHRMFTDVGISEDLTSKFATHVQEVPKSEQPSITASVMILQMGAWPVESLKAFAFTLPQEFERNICLFEAFYNKKFNGRKLTWLPYLCQCELKLCYTKRPYVISMAAPLSSLLLTFNSATVIQKAPFELFLENSGMTEMVLSKYLQILVTNKLINHEQGDEQITPSSTFTLNESFSSKKTKVRINFFQKENTTQDLEKVKTRLENDRLFYLEAVIVRVMKARKILPHNALIQEVIEQSKVRFCPSIQLIKRSICSLLERVFIERTEQDKNVYKYVAWRGAGVG